MILMLSRTQNIFLLILIFVPLVWSQTDRAVLIDSFEYPDCDSYLARMDYVSIQASNNPSKRFVIFVYEGKTFRTERKNGKSSTGWFLPEYGLGKAKIRSMKKYLASKGVQLSRFSFLPVRFREKLSIEVWMVPEGVVSPTPTPTLKKMRYRSGKPSGFCLNCCDF